MSGEDERDAPERDGADDRPESDGADDRRGRGESGNRPERDRPDDRPERDRPDEPLGDLADEVRSRAGADRSAERSAGDRGSRAERASGERPTGPESERPRQGGSDRDGPLADVASEVDDRRRRDREETDAFESVEVGEVDGEDLWEQVAEGGDGPTGTVSPDEAEVVESDAAGEVADDREVRTIPKDTCHGCPHFGDPPDLACTHEGTDILAMPETDQFRVADCPVVADDDEDIGGIEVDADDGE